MKALRLTAPGTVALEDIPIPSPGPGEVLVRVAGCGVCHTDIGFWKDGVPTRHPVPLTLGHEVSGIVVSAGSDENSDLVGREVIVPAVIPCGTCALCRTGRGNVCREQIMPGNDVDGGFAEFIVAPRRGLCIVRDRAGHDLAELSVVADAVTTPYQAIVRSGLARGDLAVVVGVGGVGGYAVQIAAALGARTVAIDVDDARLEAIRPYGAALTLNSATLDFKALKKALMSKAEAWGCPPYGIKIFECSGHPKGQEVAYGLLGPAGTLLVIGFTLGKLELRLSNLMAFDATVQGTWGCRPELYPDALSLVTAGRVQVKPFIERHPLADGIAQLERVAAHGSFRRVVLEPGA